MNLLHEIISDILSKLESDTTDIEHKLEQLIEQDAAKFFEQEANKVVTLDNAPVAETDKAPVVESDKTPVAVAGGIPPEGLHPDASAANPNPESLKESTQESDQETDLPSV